MVRAYQQLLPISRDPKLAVNDQSRPTNPRPEPIRWGSALATVPPSWQQVSDRSTRGRRTVVYLNRQAEPRLTGRTSQRAEGRLAAVVAAEPTGPAGAEGQNAIRHAVDLFGACMLIVALLAMAMFV